jgi:ribulose-phosphate 3-epimerase
MIKHAGMKAGVALNPGTPLVMLEDIITDLDMVLVMSVNPGFGGQSFITHSLDKIARLKKMITESGSNALIEVDGGVNTVTGKQLADAGADILVAGSFVFNSPDPRAAISALKDIK